MSSKPITGFSDANCFCLVDGDVYYKNGGTSYADRLVNGLRLDYVCSLNVWDPYLLEWNTLTWKEYVSTPHVSMISGIPPTDIPESVKEKEFIPFDEAEFHNDKYERYEKDTMLTAKKNKPYTHKVLKNGRKKSTSLRTKGNTYKMFIENDFIATVASADPIEVATTAPSGNLRGSSPQQDDDDDYYYEDTPMDESMINEDAFESGFVEFNYHSH